MVIFDIGCNVGNWLEANYNQQDTFIGLEPNLSAWVEAVNRFKLRRNVFVLYGMAASKNGRYKFYEADASDGSTASERWIAQSRHDTKYKHPKMISGVTLDSIIKSFGFPGYIKIDVEGYEYEVLQGMSQKTGLIAFEFVEEFIYETVKCIKYLHKLGYEHFNWINNTDDYTFKPELWFTYRQMMKALRTDIIPSRKQRWGMIYAS